MQNRKRKSVGKSGRIIALAALGALGAATLGCSEKSLVGNTRMGEAAHQPSGTDGLSGSLHRRGLGGSTRPAFNSDGLIRSVVWSLGEPGMDINSYEKNPSTGQLETWHLACRTAYDIRTSVSRHANELWVAGYQAATDAYIIERWRINADPGAYYSIKPAASSGIGTPIPLSTGSVAIKGGTYISVTPRTNSTQPNRSVQYMGLHFNVSGIRDIEVDPEGRFLLVMTKSPRNIYQIPLDGSSNATLLVTEALHPVLADAQVLQSYQNGTSGRAFVAGKHTFTGDAWLVIKDVHNDGIFDTFTTMTKSAYDSSFPTSSWKLCRNN